MLVYLFELPVTNIQAGKLLDELSDGLEGGERAPITPLVRKAARLAALLGLTEYQSVFQSHLDNLLGESARIHRQDGAPKGFDAFLSDRLHSDGRVNTMPVSLLEELRDAATQEAHRQDVGLTVDEVQHNFEVGEILRRIRNRLGIFIIDAEKTILAEAEHLAKPPSGNPMTVLSDASLLMRMLAEFEQIPNDPKRGRYNLTQHGVAETLKEKWDTDASPERLNDAVQALEDSGYLTVRRGPGTTPYRFSGVEITTAGRLEYEHQMERMQSAAKSTGRKPHAGTKIFFGHGHSPVWREVKDFVQDKLNLPWTEFDRESNAGYTTKERLETMLEEACFAFVVMTGENDGPDGTKKARDNVIHEVGLFQGKLGFNRAIVLLEAGCEEFSNIAGLTTIQFPKGDISARFQKIREVLQREELVAK